MNDFPVKGRKHFTTQRLSIAPLAPADDEFIFQLLNTEGWKRFIGDRHIYSVADAATYINRILANSNVSYWVVALKHTKERIGIVTFIKRHYLEHHDIGFAFLPAYGKCGFAYEATSAVLKQIMLEYCPAHVLATTVPGNSSSIKLLQKLGLAFMKEIEVDKEILHLYGAPAGQLSLDETNALTSANHQYHQR
jgi:[ribosomal protein S5]-alanine N-acetyltransferase